MSAHPLDNPIWKSLISRHRSIALRDGDVARYPAQVAPFLGVANADTDAAAAIAALVPADDTVLLLGRAPALPQGWKLDQLAMLAQMVCAARIGEVDGPDIIALGEAHRADVLALTALVYPHYFRPRTMDLGRYFGIYIDGRLAAMIGERMGTQEWTEISAVCVHPDFNGRSYGRRLLAFLSNDNHARGCTPFLHVSQQNLAAVQLYLGNGYALRREIPFWSLKAEGLGATE
ncbi:MAG: GNAT family N-acetyltransferase [Gammaproteobacteria bacterium]|nr:MAG: GNAT family N-acetyltransferase [Gammaproteobacteria bacterium]